MRPSFADRSSLTVDFDAIRITLASPEKILSWSHGEVTKPETINYRTFKPERDGLFCAKIFGPVTDWECLCGKYKRMKHRGVICDKCGVEVTQAKVRRERLGHITLATPVSHVWFFKGLPSRIGHLLDISLRDLERVLYFEAYVVIDPADSGLKENQLLTEEEYRKALEEHGAFHAQMGAEAIKELLRTVEIEDLAVELRQKMRDETSVQKKLKYAKRLKVVDSFRRSTNRPEWMILDVIPVIPPELRPLVPLDGGRFATSDLNDLYRRVINRNNRLKKLIELKAPDVIIRNEKRMLQEAVDALFDNGRRGRVLRGANNRPLKSLSDTLKGKQGRFRQNLLGKRVDYSGRSVIVVGPELKLHQCGLPKKMALELFKPFIYNKLEQREMVATIKQAREMVEQHEPEVWDILEEVIREHPVLLNRAPTLHRLGIQAFEPVLVEGKAIRIHPLVCTAFNADFDGDQMAVHVPLSPEAQIEASVLMLSSNNIMSPSSGTPIAVPSQDIVLGCYYLTKANPHAKGVGRIFGIEEGEDGKPRPMRKADALPVFRNEEDVLLALESGDVETLTPIRFRLSGPYMDLAAGRDDQDVLHTAVQKLDREIIETTVGRVVFNHALPDEIPFVNGLLKKKGLQQLVQYSYLRRGLELTVQMLDRLKDLGFLYATKSGMSIGINDLVIPEEKARLVDSARESVIEVEKQYNEGAITDREKKNKIIDIWSGVTEKIADEMFVGMENLDQDGQAFNPVFVMADSGARGSKQQMRQLAGMRGLMAKPSGEIIETPITSNFREGLTVLQYFISTHGARKGLADTALKTADSGYLTRRLVDVAQDVIISEIDCGTIDGIEAQAIVESGEIIEPLRDRIIGRVSLERVCDPVSGKILAEPNTEIDEELASEIQEAGIETVKIRSVLTCESRRGVCARCYGRDLGTGKLVELGLAVGVIAAQSIGEPGTQLTMRTFHIGGTASGSEQSTHVSKHEGVVELKGVQAVWFDAQGKAVPTGSADAREGVVMNRTGELIVRDSQGRLREHYELVYGARLKVRPGETAEIGETLVEWDPYTRSILTENSGVVHFEDIKKDITFEEKFDEVTGLTERIIIDAPEEKQPAIRIVSRHPIPMGAVLHVRKSGAEVAAGDELATGPHGEPVQAGQAGKVRFENIDKHVVQIEDVEHRYEIPAGAAIQVSNGAQVSAGDELAGPPDGAAIVAEQAGRVRFEGGDAGADETAPAAVVIEQRVVGEDDAGVVAEALAAIPFRAGEKRRVVGGAPGEKKLPVLAIEGRRYPMPARAHLMVSDGDQVHATDVLAKIPRETTKTKDITGGLPRVVELFEARKPRETAVISEIDGTVKQGGIVKGVRKIIIVPDEPGAEQREYSLPRSVHLNVQEGDRVRAGDPLMDGPSNPHDILSVLGEKALHSYLVNEIQEVYRLQGVAINDKHIEVMVRQMMRWVKIEDVGDTELLVDEQVDRFRFAAENERVLAEGGQPATGRPLLLGITKASLSTDSFISAASFQETTRVLTEASISGKVDHLRGLKENVTMGRLIPAGTGFDYYRQVRIEADEPPPPPLSDDLDAEHEMDYFVDPDERGVARSAVGAVDTLSPLGARETRVREGI
ncbi:MAG: DNA-directed RNA polymerase subunit beta' [Acidobacteria bacterium]|nr:DNA-directed RNA polymerase subunit beta' [Acidobacteriota bacterium]